MSLNNVVPGAMAPGEFTARAWVTSAIARLGQAAPEGSARRGAQAPPLPFTKSTPCTDSVLRTPAA